MQEGFVRIDTFASEAQQPVERSDITVNKFIGLVVLCVVLSVIVSIAVVAGLARVFDFTFDSRTAAIVGVLSASVAGASVASLARPKRKK